MSMEDLESQPGFEEARARRMRRPKNSDISPLDENYYVREAEFQKKYAEERKAWDSKYFFAWGQGNNQRIQQLPLFRFQQGGNSHYII